MSGEFEAEVFPRGEFAVQIMDLSGASGAEPVETITGYLQKGQLKYRAHVLEGLDSAIDGINMLFNGENQGKLLVKF